MKAEVTRSQENTAGTSGDYDGLTSPSLAILSRATWLLCGLEIVSVMCVPST